MSTKLHDVASQAILGVGLAPQTITDSAAGASLDLLAGDGPCFAIQQVGAVSGASPTLAGKLQESGDGTNWSDIAGAAFTSVAATGNIQALTFTRSQRFVRYVATLGGSSPSFAVSAIVSQQKKQV